MVIHAYTRLSPNPQEDGGPSLEIQGRIIQGWASIRGVEIDRVWVETRVSGATHVKQRAAGARMLEALRHGDTVVAASLDRMFGSASDAAALMVEFQTSRIELILIDLGNDPLGDGIGRVVLKAAAAFAQSERDHCERRALQVKAQQREAGLYVGGVAPFGTKVGMNGRLEADEAALDIVATVMDQRAGGASLRQIRAAVLDRHGRSVSLATLSKIVKGATSR